MTSPAAGQNRQTGRAKEIIVREAAQFIAREASTKSLITVVGARSTAEGDRVAVFVTVFPEEKAREALSFLERQRPAFSDYLKRHSRIALPHVDFLLDTGEFSRGPGGN